MFILGNRIFNKISTNLKQSVSNKKDQALLSDENEKLKNNISNLNKEYDKSKETNDLLENENKHLTQEINQLKKENDKLKKLNSFINFEEFLSNSYVSPMIYAPFIAQDKRVFAFMDHLSKYLIQNTLKIKDKPLVSIIMPTYNRERIINKAIDSVLEQSYDNWELIIVDDGSSDNTLSLLNQITNSKIKILSHDKNKGVAFARNTGLKGAVGEYVMYLDSDNQWDSRYVETMVGAFIELPQADAIYSGQLLYKDDESKPHAVRFGSFNKSLLHNRNYIDMSCFCHKRSVFEEIGGFNENLTHLSDWDYILKIANNFNVFSVPVLLSKYYEYSNLNRISDIPFDYYETASKILENNIQPSKKFQALSRRVSIIIPNYESLTELKSCVETILSFNLKEMVDIIIVDNNSSAEVKEFVKNLESKQVKIILNDINYGFTYAVKQAIELSDNDSDILLLNNDALLTNGAIEHLQNGAYAYDDCGLIVPHELISENNKHMNYNVPYADKGFKCDVTPSKEHHNIINMPVFHDGGLLELEFAPFFCTYIKRDVYEKTLGLDPELGRHYRSDRIFSDFIRHILKMKIYQEPNAYVYHKHQVATDALKKNKEEYDLMFGKNQWPEDLAEKLGYKKSLWD